ncbi:uncharacterized protein LOC131887275 [Tigriopus californicus]|nr:uncharacterized protein LOC131887275 [Tigriopus californicus]
MRQNHNWASGFLVTSPPKLSLDQQAPNLEQQARARHLSTRVSQSRDPCPMSGPSVLSRVWRRGTPHRHLQALRTGQRLASNFSYYLKDGSNPNPISNETRHLLQNQKHVLDMPDWERGPGIQDPLVYPMKDPLDRDDDQTYDITYWPHKGQVMAEEFQDPSPILLVKRVRTLICQPYYHKEACERLGLGQFAPMEKIAVLPNTPTMCWRLVPIKHLIEIIPLTFPMGYPSNEEFDPACCRINQKGEFYYHPKLKKEDQSLFPQHEMCISDANIEREANHNYYKTSTTISPMGNANFHRDTSTTNREMNDWHSDASFKIKFKELIPEGSERVFLGESKYVYD